MNFRLLTYVKNFFEFILHPIRTWFSFLRRAIPGLKWLANLKPEVLAAVLTFIFLLTIWIFTRFGGQEGAADRQTQLIGWGITLAVIVAIPVVLYFFLRVLLAPPKSPYPDIDESWTVGLKALEKSGLSIKDLPVYLVMGMRDTKQIRAFMEASGKQFDVEGATGAGQTLIWYGSKDHVFVFLAGVGNFTEFTCKTQKMPLLHDVEEKDFTSTANIAQFYKVSDSVVDSPADEPEELSPEAMMATVRASDAISSSEGKATQAKPKPKDERRPARESVRAKTSEQRKRINHLSNLVRRARAPVSPVNGLLLNVDVNVLESYPEEMARQLRDDLRGISTELGVICAMTTVVSGLENDNGFINFAERLVEQNGPEFAKSKFGKSYRTWTPPTAEQLEQVAESAVEEFDHFVHLIFTKRDALGGIHVQGNRDLVLFICRLYSTILPGLKVLLGKGCSLPESTTEIEFPRFAGCYFAGNNAQNDYFLEKVFDRVEENMSELEWTRRSLRTEDNWRTLSNLGYLIGLSSLVAFVFMIVYEMQK